MIVKLSFFFVLITSTAGIRTSWFEACQFRIDSLAQKEIVTECGPKNTIRQEFLQCSSPFLEKAAETIKKQCCSGCIQCSGCEDDDSVSADQYEKDSPGQVPTNSAPIEKASSNKLRN